MEMGGAYAWPSSCHVGSITSGMTRLWRDRRSALVVFALGLAVSSCTGRQSVTPTPGVTTEPTATIRPTPTVPSPVTTETPNEARGPIEWAPTAGFPIDGVFWAIAVEPGDPQRLYAAVENLGFLHSRDGGLTWQRNDVGHHFARGILLDPVDDDNLYYAYGSGLAVYDRATGSHQWNVELEDGDRPSASLDPPSYTLANRVAAVVAEATGGTIYLSSPAGVFRTTDHGRNFEPIGRGLPGPTIYSALATHPADPDVLYVGTRGPW